MKLNLKKYEEIKPKRSEIILDDIIRTKKKKFIRRVIHRKISILKFITIITIIIIIISFLLIFINHLLFKRKNNKTIINSILENLYYTLNIKNPKFNWEDEKLVMHAFGKYKNTIYTNSYEALNYWYNEKKMKLMEADFFLTKDNHVVCAHEFNHLNYVPTLEEFKKSFAKGNLTPMTFEDLVIFMEKNKDLYIITDSKYKDKPNIKIQFDEMDEIINKYNVRERFIIQVYNEEMFLYLKENYNFVNYLFTLYQRWNIWDKSEGNYKDLEKIFNFCSKNKIKAIVMPNVGFNSRINDISKNYSVPIYLHTENNIAKIADFLRYKCIKGIYTDEVDNSALNEYISNLNKLVL